MTKTRAKIHVETQLLLTVAAHGCCSRLLLTVAAHGCCSQLLLTVAAHGCCSQLLLTVAAHVCCSRSAAHGCCSQLCTITHNDGVAALVCKDDQSEPLCICLAIIILFCLTDV